MTVSTLKPIAVQREISATISGTMVVSSACDYSGHMFKYTFQQVEFSSEQAEHL